MTYSWYFIPFFGLVAGSLALPAYSSPLKHPYSEDVRCETGKRSYLTGVMFDARIKNGSAISEFEGLGHVAGCESAANQSRNGQVCTFRSHSSYVVRDLATGQSGRSFASLSECIEHVRGPIELRTDPGYLDFIDPAELQALLQHLPVVADPVVNAALSDSQTMWYDEASLGYVYQDSFGSPKGLRMNRVGYDVGIRSTHPDIRLLTSYFEQGRFRFPFGIFSGHHDSGVYSLSFWHTPSDGTGVLPVRYWKNNSHYEWVFPIGTTVGEVLFLRAPDGEWMPFEIRARVRQTTEWASSVWRPYTTAVELASAIKAKRPNWQSTDLKALVDHLLDQSTLKPHILDTGVYSAVEPSFVGSLDILPGTSDSALIKSLLKAPEYFSANGKSWKENGGLKTFAASTSADFHIVPKGYEGGMLEVSNAACARCHQHVSRPLKDLDSRIVLYGEFWGEDQVFTWHPFEIDASSFTTSDGNRSLNKRMISAGLILEGRPLSSDLRYSLIPKPFRAVYE
jgi:hypothetical protein